MLFHSLCISEFLTYTIFLLSEELLLIFLLGKVYCLPWHIFISPLLLKGNFTGYKILSISFSLSTFQMLRSLFAWLLKRRQMQFFSWLSDSFKIFSSSLTFCNSNMIGVDFCIYVLLVISELFGSVVLCLSLSFENSIIITSSVLFLFPLLFHYVHVTPFVIVP